MTKEELEAALAAEQAKNTNPSYWGLGKKLIGSGVSIAANGAEITADSVVALKPTVNIIRNLGIAGEINSQQLVGEMIDKDPKSIATFNAYIATYKP